MRARWEKKNRKGQATTEMMILWAVVIVALIFMMGLLGRHSKGYVMNQAKQMSSDPWGNSAVYTASSKTQSTTNSNSTQSSTNSNTGSNTTLNMGAVVQP